MLNHSPTWKDTRNLSLASSGEVHEHASKTCLELLKVCCVVKVRCDSNQCYEEENFWEKGKRDKTQSKLSAHCQVVSCVFCLSNCCSFSPYGCRQKKQAGRWEIALQVLQVSSSQWEKADDIQELKRRAITKLLEITILQHRKFLSTHSLGRFIHLVVINLQIRLALQLFLVLSCTEIAVSTLIKMIFLQS